MNIDEVFTVQPSTGEKVPLYSMSVSAGYPVNVESEVEDMIDINEYLIEHPASTFFAKVKGEPLAGTGIQDNDIVIFDTSIRPQNGKVVIAVANEGMTIKIYREMDGIIYLQSSDNHFLPLKIGDFLEFKIIGVVTKVIHSF